MTVWAATALLTFCWFSPLAQVRAAKPVCECICMQHWDALINIAALAEGGVGEGQIYILVHGQTEFQLQSQKGMYSGREAHAAQTASTCEES